MVSQLSNEPWDLHLLRCAVCRPLVLSNNRIPDIRSIVCIWDVGQYILALSWDSENHGSLFLIFDFTKACLYPGSALCSLLPPSPLIPSVSRASCVYPRCSRDPLSDLVTPAVAMAPVATPQAFTILCVSTLVWYQNPGPNGQSGEAFCWTNTALWEEPLLQ